MIDKVLAQLIDFIKSASPIIWETYVRQVYMEAIKFSVGGIVLLTLCIAGIIGATKGLKRYDAKQREKQHKEYELADDDNIGWWALLIVSELIGVMSVLIIIGAVTRCLNPYYYAIQLILETIR